MCRLFCTNSGRFLLAFTLLPGVGCQTAGERKGADASPTDLDQQESLNQYASEREQLVLDFRVTGADAEKAGDSKITLDYPMPPKTMNDILPDWVFNPGSGGVLGAVGVSSRRGQNIKEQIEEARLSGRIELATMFEARIQRVSRNEVEENTRFLTEKLDEDSRKNRLGLDRDIVDAVVAGSRQRSLWFDPNTSDCFAWMVIDRKILERVDHFSQDGLSVFRANESIESEYQRPRPERPNIILQISKIGDEKPADHGPEEIESQLRPLESIPSSQGLRPKSEETE